MILVKLKDINAVLDAIGVVAVFAHPITTRFVSIADPGGDARRACDQLHVWWGYDKPAKPITPAAGADLGHLELLDQVELERRMRGVA